MYFEYLIGDFSIGSDFFENYFNFSDILTLKIQSEKITRVRSSYQLR